MASGDAKTRQPRRRRSSNAAAETSTGSTERRAKIQHISALVGTVVAVLALVVTVIAYIFPRSGPSAAPERIPFSSAGQHAVVVSTDLQARACTEEGALKSRVDDVKTVIQFINRSSEAIRLYWINYDGARESFGKLSSGQTQEFYTYLTHPWLVGNASGQCIGIFLPAKKPGRAVIQ